MKNSDVIRLKVLTVRPKTAERLFEAPHLFNEMVRFGWIKPCYKSNRCTLYLVTDLEKCALRLAAGDRPGEGPVEGTPQKSSSLADPSAIIGTVQPGQ